MSGSIKRVLSATLVTVGGIIGAGFASGREIYVFFKGENRAFLAGVSVFFAMLVFSLSVYTFGRKRKVSSMRDFSAALLGKRAYFFDVAFGFCFYIVIAAMLSATDELFSFCGVRFPLFSLISVLITGFFVARGIKGVTQLSCVLTPILVLFIVAITLGFKGKAAESAKAQNAVITGVNATMYVAMNFCLSAVVMAEWGGKMTKRECLASSLLTSTVIALLVAFFIKAMSCGDFAAIPIPLVVMTEGRGRLLAAFSIITLYFAILTTLLSSSLPLFSWYKTRRKGAILPLVATFLPAFLLSGFGFVKILSSLYPIQSVIGLIALILIISDSVLPAFQGVKRGNTPPLRGREE